MFQNKPDILLFLFNISAFLIFAEKILDQHHAYNRRSEIISSITKILSNLIDTTCLISAVKLLWLSYHLISSINKIWHSISSSSGILILDVWRSIELTIKKSKYYEVLLNIIKMNYSGKCELETLTL